MKIVNQVHHLLLNFPRTYVVCALTNIESRVPGDIKTAIHLSEKVSGVTQKFIVWADALVTWVQAHAKPSYNSLPLQGSRQPARIKLLQKYFTNNITFSIIRKITTSHDLY